MRVPVKVWGGAAPSSSRPISSKLPLNMFIEVTDSELAPAAALSWPGFAEFSTDFGGNHRGWKKVDGVVYKISGDNFHSIDSAGTKTLLGVISGTERCYFAANSGVITIVTGGVAYLYDSGTLTQITDIDLGSPYTVAMLNNYWVYGGIGNIFTVSDFATPESIPTNYIANAESDGDNLVRVYSFQERVYMFGEETIEPWYFTGSGEPPFARETGGVIPKGLGARASIAKNHEFVFFLANDHSVYRLSGYQIQPILNQQIAKIFEGYVISDASAYMIRQSGQDFYVIHFPAESATWAISSDLGFAYKISNQSIDHVYAFGKNLVAVDSKVLEMSAEYYTDCGSTMIRELIVGPITSKGVGLQNGRMMIRSFRLMIETGVSLITGEGSDADIMFSISVDGGRTFTDDSMVSVGRLGDYLKDVDYYVMKKGMSFQVKIRVSDPINLSVHDASADLEFGGY